MATDAFECFLSSEDETNVKLVFCPHGAKSKLQVTNQFFFPQVSVDPYSPCYLHGLVAFFWSLIIIVTTVFSLGSLLNPFGINQRDFKGSK